MRLRGILWKPGINGLGVLGFHRLPYRKRFDYAARQHDELYDIKNGTRKDRRVADIFFFQSCLQNCRTDLHCFMAIIYFVLVRLFGWAFFRYDR